MMKLIRSDTPEVLKINSGLWGKEFAQKRTENPKCKFSWKHHESKSIRDVILPILKTMTQNHCSFCDGFPLGTESRDTVEHFRPKSLFPELAYEWENLFLCCDVCQSAKLEKFDELLLKPDEVEYAFYRYFMNNYKTGEILPNPKASETDRLRADKTIALYDLNAEERCQSRLRTARVYQKVNEPLSDFSYRFFLEELSA